MVTGCFGVGQLHSRMLRGRWIMVATIMRRLVKVDVWLAERGLVR